MEFLRKWWAQWLAFLKNLSFAERALVIMSAAVLAAIILALVLLTGSPTMVPLLPVPADRMAAVRTRLDAAGIKAEVRGTQVFVPVDKQTEAMAILAQNDLLSGDTSAAWDEMIARQNPLQPNSEHAQLFLLAKQKVLALIIGKMAGVHSADVMLDMPVQQGFGSTAVRPSASINIVMQPGQTVERHLVDAVAGLVSGAVAGLKPQDVVVIDANLGRQFTAKSGSDVGAGERLEQIEALEAYTHDKIARLLEYIPGVIIAVNVRTDTVVTKSSRTTNYEKTEPLASEESKETEQQTSSGDGGEAGVRANVGERIEGGNASRTTNHTTDSQTTYREKPVIAQSEQVEVGQPFERINVTVNVPRRFFVAMFKASTPAKAGAGAGDTAPAEPDDATLKPVIESELADITAQIKPLMQAQADGLIAVHMIPDPGILLAAAGGAGAGGLPVGAAPLALFWQSDLGKLLPVGGLVIVSLALLAMLGRWAMREPKMPTVEELAGVPRVLPSEEELVGEADAHDPTMAGVELDEEQIRTRRIAEQIGEMVRSNPGEAATLFNRWVRKED